MNIVLSGKTSLFCILYLLFIYGCESTTTTHGKHEIVDLNSRGAASREIYISFLLDQIESDPEVSTNYIKLSGIYRAQGRDDQALLLLQKASRETYHDISIMLELGKLYLELQDIENLSATLKSIRNRAEENVDFLKLSAGYSLLLKDYTNAIFFANRAMLENPYDDENIYFLASAKLINKDSINAYQAFKEAYELKPSGKNFVKMFELALALEETENAKSYLLEFERENKEIDCCYFWGAYYNTIGQKDMAKGILLACNENRYSENRINLELAKSYYPTIIDSTLFYVNKYLNNQANDIRAIVLKANALERNSHFTEARNLYQTAIKIDSTSALAIDGLENLERKVAYLRLIKRKESIQRDLEILKPLNSKEIN